MTQALSSKYWTVEEYLALEEASEERHEYFNGEIFVMSGGSLNHSLIITNMLSILRSKFRPKGCTTYDSNLRLLITNTGLYTYADALVVCGEPDLVVGRDDTITNPTVIVEVLSDSTRNYDRGLKSKRYMAIADLRYYVLIESKAVLVERRQRGEKSELAVETYVELEDTLILPDLEVEIPLAEIYDGVKFDLGRGKIG